MDLKEQFQDIETRVLKAHHAMADAARAAVKAGGADGTLVALDSAIKELDAACEAVDAFVRKNALAIMLETLVGAMSQRERAYAS